MLLVMIPFNLLTGLVTVSATSGATSQSYSVDTMDEDGFSVNRPDVPMWFGFWAMFAGLLNGFVVFPLTNAAVIHAVARLYLGQPVTAVEAIRLAFGRLLPLIGTTILFGLAVMGGMILLIIPGILFAIWFGLYQHVVVLESIAGQKALGRSKKLVSPHWTTFLALGLIVWVITVAAQFGSALIPQPHLQQVVFVLATAVVTIVGTAAWVVYYFSCRCAVENFDLHYLAQSIGEEPPPPSEQIPPARAAF
jgi:hypothetical protein